MQINALICVPQICEIAKPMFWLSQRISTHAQTTLHVMCVDAGDTFTCQITVSTVIGKTLIPQFEPHASGARCSIFSKAVFMLRWCLPSSTNFVCHFFLDL